MTDFNAFAPNYSVPADLLAGFHGPILEHSDSGKNNSIRFDSEFDKTDACTLIVTHRLIISYDYFLIVCIIDFL